MHGARLLEIREWSIHNDYALAAPHRGACGVWLNPELTLAEIMHLAKTLLFLLDT